jgi:serine/threonine-protein kinase
MKKKSQISSQRSKLHLSRGKRLSKYHLERCLDTGGSCEIWKARDSVENIRVALKIPLVINGRRDNQQLLREIRLVARLRHRHIMPVKNADIINNYVVLATELSVGTLAERSKPMAVRNIISITAQVLDGLAYAHRHKVVHCDVTPSNIFLFPDGRAAIGDFGISLQLKGRMKTIDEYGTPGYVAPEQAYGRPTYRSDCFSVALILYEYITGVLPRWPFRWPGRGYKRLCERTSPAVVKFLRHSLKVDPNKRFADAGEMLVELLQAIPKNLKIRFVHSHTGKRKIDWRGVRRQVFIKKYNKVLTFISKCVTCGEPIDERMSICPWCGSNRNRFDNRSRFSHFCPDCHKGVLPEWRYCPWCYGAGFDSPVTVRSTGIKYQGKCKFCGGKLIRFMRYCPWCHRKIRQPWQFRTFPEFCSRCDNSIDTDFWNWCPWCKQSLFVSRSIHNRK